MEAAVLDTLFAQSAVGLHVLDTRLRVMRANTLSGAVPDERLVGRHFTEAYHLEEPDEAERILRKVLDSGVAVRDRVVRGRPADSTGRSRSLRVSVYRLNDADGRTLGLLAAVVDVDEQEKARIRAACLTAVRTQVGRSLDVAATCEGLVEAVVPAFADLAVVEVVDDVLRGSDPKPGPLEPDVPLRRAAVRGLGADEYRSGLVGEMRRLPDRTPYALAASDLKPRLVQIDARTPWLEADPDSARLVEATRAHSLIVVPLKLHGTVLGLASLFRCRGTEPFEENDLPPALTAAAHVALSIDNARRYARDHAIASTVQRRLLPQNNGGGIAVETAHVLLPGRNSGCWFDTIGLSGARTALIVGDVEAPGLQAAITMGQLRTVIHALAGLDLEPDEVLARLADTAGRLAGERAALPPGDWLHRQPPTATCMYAVYDPFSRTCTVARSGHPSPVLVTPDGTTTALDVPDGPRSSPPTLRRTPPLRSSSTKEAFWRSSPALSPPTGTPRIRYGRHSRDPAGICRTCATTWSTTCRPRPALRAPCSSSPVPASFPPTGSRPGSWPMTGPLPPSPVRSCATGSTAGAWTRRRPTRPNSS